MALLCNRKGYWVVKMQPKFKNSVTTFLWNNLMDLICTEKKKRAETALLESRFQKLALLESRFPKKG